MPCMPFFHLLFSLAANFHRDFFIVVVVVVVGSTAIDRRNDMHEQVYRAAAAHTSTSRWKTVEAFASDFPFRFSFRFATRNTHRKTTHHGTTMFFRFAAVVLTICLVFDAFDLGTACRLLVPAEMLNGCIFDPMIVERNAEFDSAPSYSVTRQNCNSMVKKDLFGAQPLLYYGRARSVCGFCKLFEIPAKRELVVYQRH